MLDPLFSAFWTRVFPLLPPPPPTQFFCRPICVGQTLPDTLFRYFHARAPLFFLPPCIFPLGRLLLCFPLLVLIHPSKLIIRRFLNVDVFSFVCVHPPPYNALFPLTRTFHLCFSPTSLLFLRYPLPLRPDHDPPLYPEPWSSLASLNFIANLTILGVPLSFLCYA